MNTVKNTFSDIHAGVDTDHYPLIADISVNLKANYRKHKTRTFYNKCNIEEKRTFNPEFGNTLPMELTHADITEWIKQAAKTKQSLD